MIETARLVLRPHRLADFEASYALSSDPEVVRFLGPPASREDAWNRLLRYGGHWALLGFGMFAVFERASGRFLGETGLAHFGRGLGELFDPYAEAAWVMVVAAQGQGFALEAVTAAHDWFEAERGAARTVCIIHPDHGRSIRLAETLGYRSFGQTTYRDAPVKLFERLRLE